jgi:hypothetical protein
VILQRHGRDNTGIHARHDLIDTRQESIRARAGNYRLRVTYRISSG